MEQPYVVVVGGVNIDICGKAFEPLIPCDSNPGSVRMSMGGVGRNIAHNLSLLGQKVYLLTALGEDDYADDIRANCALNGIDLTYACTVPEGRTSTYVYLAGPDGDMALAVCDNEIARFVTPGYLEDCLPVLNGAAAVVIDTNLSEDAVVWLGRNVTAPLFADAVSVAKAKKLRPILDRLHTVKPNRMEAEALCGIRARDEAGVRAAADALLTAGTGRVFISLGADGIYCAEGDARLLVPCPPAEPVNDTGGGDALTAGLVRAFTAGLGLRDSAALALACAAINVEGADTINPRLSLPAAMQRAGL
ncbi:MAG: PfkB family carbohydrate kinase [Candidatus Faecousia sp.]|nr:PfkB family carbohydrate kinase [Candidatus Faecousia sp.]